ncbi:MAG: hypothetical protein IJ299_04415 [Oscillospiraceae bacterium]|nr:hypothetical protein [Oscillospiraceae bacterium]
MFEIGKLVTTIEVSKAMEKDERFSYDVIDSIRRFVCGDWGDIPQEDVEENIFALENDLRIIGVYPTSHKRIWIITEADRSVTTILFPSEY